MTDSNIAAMLRTIAANPADDVARLILADYLEEHGAGERAEFIRVQCEIRRHVGRPPNGELLRQREWELLNLHRAIWIQDLALPLEDVQFERGLISAVRLKRWEPQAFLDPDRTVELSAIRELDLSGLNLRDADLAAFAAHAQFPNLRKLIVSDNALTASGLANLAESSGLPQLECLYLFGNPGLDGAAVQIVSPRFEQRTRLKANTIDCGKFADGYCMSPGQAEMARRRIVREEILPLVQKQFEAFPLLRSASLNVAQYWADEANDAVHAALVVSELLEPTLRGVRLYDSEKSDPNIPNTIIKNQYNAASSSAIEVWGQGVDWDDNNRAIPLWAAFAPEDAHQEYSELAEAYAPAVLFFRHGGYEFQPMLRPFLDGVRSEWSEYVE